MTSSTSVAVLGLGAMGTRMAANLAATGHEVTVWNRSPGPAADLAASAGVAVADRPRSAAQGAAVVITMVTDDRASADLWLDPDAGILPVMRHDAVGVEQSTITVGHARRLAEAATAANVSLIEAPVVGSRPQAEAGALVHLVGGDPDVLDRVRPVLDVNAGAIHHLGPIGSAATMKLAINGLFAAQVAAYAEIAGLLDRSGLDLDAALATLSGLPITSPALQRTVGLIGARQFDPNFPIRLVAKDLGYLGELGAELGAETPIADATASTFASAADTDLADLDISGIAAQYR